jgi:hypothetical protein
LFACNSVPLPLNVIGGVIQAIFRLGGFADQLRVERPNLLLPLAHHAVRVCALGVGQRLVAFDIAASFTQRLLPFWGLALPLLAGESDARVRYQLFDHSAAVGFRIGSAGGPPVRSIFFGCADRPNFSRIH